MAGLQAYAISHNWEDYPLESEPRMRREDSPSMISSSSSFADLANRPGEILNARLHDGVSLRSGNWVVGDGPCIGMTKSKSSAVRTSPRTG